MIPGLCQQSEAVSLLTAFFTSWQAIPRPAGGLASVKRQRSCRGSLSRRNEMKADYCVMYRKRGSFMKNFHYVYILIDIATETHHYVGSTQDLQARLAKHNAGEVPHTSKFKPWRIQTAIAFDNKEKAVAFEDYLKTGSGREFSKRHF